MTDKVDLSGHCHGEGGIDHDTQVRHFGTCDGCGATTPNPPIAVPAAFRTPPPSRPADHGRHGWASVETTASGNVIAHSTPDSEGMVTMKWLKGGWS